MLCGNKKIFDGTIVKSYQELLDHFETYDYVPNIMDEYYVCSVITILSEHRVLIGGNKIYGIGHKNESKIIDEEFIEEIRLLSDNMFYTIDIGYTMEHDWCIIEINPPFSIDDWGINLDSYMIFCMDYIDKFVHKYCN